MTAKQRGLRGVFERPRESGIWWINYYDSGGRRHREKIGRYSVASEAYLQRRIEVREGKFTPPRSASTITFGELMDEALAQKRGRISPLSFRMDELRVRALRPILGTLPASNLTAVRIDEVLRGLREKLSGPTVNRYRSLLSSVFSFAVRSGRLHANPIRQVPRYKESEGRVRFLTVDEEKALRKIIRRFCPEREAELDLALHTGIRRGEQFSLKWENVDLERGILTVNGKTGRRHVAINSTARAALERLRRAAHGSPFVTAETKSAGQRDWRRWFEWCAHEAKIENFRWHDMRHTFASRLVMAGVDLRTVQELLGHKSILMTMRYAHLSPSHNQSAVEKIVAKEKASPVSSRKKVVGIR
jgi:integrase